MVIWKDGVPYVVRTVDDLADVIDKEIFEDVKEFIEDAIQDSEVVNKLYEEKEDLECNMAGLVRCVHDLKAENKRLKDELAEKEAKDKEEEDLNRRLKNVIKTIADML